MRPLNHLDIRRHSNGTKMRIASLLLNFGILLLAFVALLQVQGTNAKFSRKTVFQKRAEIERGCPSDVCLPAEKCETEAIDGFCNNDGHACCRLVKLEHRTPCRYWGGECMDDCIPSLTERATDCPASQKCCVL